MDWADDFWIGLYYVLLQAYVQELEKEVRRLVNENLKLKRQCKQVRSRTTFFSFFIPSLSLFIIQSSHASSTYS